MASDWAEVPLLEEAQVAAQTSPVKAAAVQAAGGIGRGQEEQAVKAGAKPY